jgi:hypothetical protein
MAGLNERFATHLQKLGKVKAGKGCLYIKKLADIDLAVLRDMIRDNVAHLIAFAKPSSEPKPKKRSVKKS